MIKLERRCKKKYLWQLEARFCYDAQHNENKIKNRYL